ncbi:NAD-capped RNA hydrolase NUDT12 [Diretmus argenteus]
MTSLQLSAKDEMVERFLDAAARGDLTSLSPLLSNYPALINQSGHRGWSGLMLAARNGHFHVVEMLLAEGCDKFSVNSSSQTAFDIAKFWGHRRISDLLARTDDACQRALPTSDLTQRENYFSRETLDRLSERRTDGVWLEAKQSSPDSVYILFSNLRPMLCSREEAGPGVRVRSHQAFRLSTMEAQESAGFHANPWASTTQTKLCRFGHDAVRDLLQKPGTVLIFLGVEKQRKPSSSSSTSSQTEERSREPPAWFAINIDEESNDLLQLSREANSFFPQQLNRDLLQLSEDEAGILSQARAVLAWHSRYSYCPTCGSSTRLEEGGYKRSCLRPDCRSLQGIHNTSYPRVDPVVIMLVIHPDGNQCLLGRKKIFPVGMFSCLAGFIEPGETIEEAVRREVEEESGVKVGPVQYVSCQPWPMPSSLMIGCLAVAVSTDIRVDENEIEEARWFPRQQVTDALFKGAKPAFTLPPRQTIAHQLVRHWIGMTSNL